MKNKIIKEKLKDFPEALEVLFPYELPEYSPLKSKSTSEYFACTIWRTTGKNSYGIVHDDEEGDYYLGNSNWDIEYKYKRLQKATNEEWIKVMIPELKRRGVFEGVRINSALLDTYGVADFTTLSVADKFGTIIAENEETGLSIALFYKGKFATPIHEIEKGTRVYCWDGDDRPKEPNMWYYLRFENGMHYCYSNSKDGISDTWGHVEVIKLKE